MRIKSNREFYGTIGLKEPWFQNVLIYGLMGISFFVLFPNLHNIVEYGFFVLLLFWILNLLKDQLQVVSLKKALQRTPLDYPFLLFLSWILVIVPWAIDPSYSFAEWRKTLAHIVIFYFVVNVVKTKEEVGKILDALLFGVFVMSVFGIGNFLSEGGDVFVLSERAGSFGLGSQWLSTFLIMTIPIYLFRFSMSSEFIWRLSYGMGLGIAFGALWLTHTRAAYLAVLFQVFLYLLLKHIRNGILISSILLIFLLGFMGLLLGFSTDQSLVDRNSLVSIESMQRRFATWPIALQDIWDNPVTGLGYGQRSFEIQHPELGEGFIHKNVHNTFLQKLVQCGVPGAMMFLLIFAIIFRTNFQIWSQQSKNFAGQFALAIMIMAFGVVVRNMFDDMFLGNLVYLFWLLIGLSFCVSRVTLQEDSREVSGA